MTSTWMKLTLGAGLFALAACSEPVPADATEPVIAPSLVASGAPRTPVEALAPYYAQLEYVAPVAPEGPALPGTDAVLTSIAFGSCNTAQREIPILATIAAESHDLFMYVGDNVYGDARSYNADLPELRENYAALAARPEFRLLRSALPMLATWDDHDYGMNDLGRDFPFKGFSEQLFLDFWRAPEDDARRQREGIYDAQVFGPEGRRVQIIMLDTRYFRSDLTPTDEQGAAGRERYIPSTNPDQDMLGAAQWAWLADQLAEPADLRLIVSSIQVLADGHGWEAWRTMPLERDRLFRLINEAGAEGVVFVSGDRHSAGLYRRDDVASYPLYEITSSALNMASNRENTEAGPNRLGSMYSPENYGVIGIDWDQGRLNLEIRDMEGDAVRRESISLSAIGAL
ncbi:alkaline phosphatase D family protein [Oceanicaulis sp. LC35]|uniref:alkaline phosphatase D family protein n=1 Tax=Oceanicaulis sp. LC35 TaxID=3349635 RepID=UPI003F879DA5